MQDLDFSISAVIFLRTDHGRLTTLKIQDEAAGRMEEEINIDNLDFEDIEQMRPLAQAYFDQLNIVERRNLLMNDFEEPEIHHNVNLNDEEVELIVNEIDPN